MAPEFLIPIICTGLGVFAAAACIAGMVYGMRVASREANDAWIRAAETRTHVYCRGGRFFVFEENDAEQPETVDDDMETPW
jgi:hypothetical protein